MIASVEPAGEPRGEAPRLRSLDALRGFDMLWITGGSALVGALAASTDLAALDWLEGQTQHVEWHGFTLWDLVFPLFLFVAGAALPFALVRRLEAGAPRAALARKVVRRGLVLVLLGLVYNGLLTFDFAELRYASVLGRIGLAYAGAGLIVLACGVRGWILWAAGLLVAYWIALRFVPVPGHGAGNLAPGATLTDWVDRLLLPGRLHRGDRDPEGLLATVPAVATALLGALAGTWLRRRERSVRTALQLLAAGVATALLGALWSLDLPLNKNLWTSSFTLWTAGWSAVLLALSYLVVDVLGHERLAFPFVVIGMNAITIYLLERFVDFEGIVRLVLARGEGRLHPALLPAAALLLRWGVLYALYRRRVFLRV